MNPKNKKNKETEGGTNQSAQKMGGLWVDPMCFPSLNYVQEESINNDTAMVKRTGMTANQPAFKKGTAIKNLRCHVCWKNQAVTVCDHCGKELCKDCQKLEIWSTGAEDLSAKYFCPECKDNPDVNPWGARPEESIPEDDHDPITRDMPIPIVKTVNGLI
ncbi:MAG: hypothetical protein ABSB79_06200 [Syntrophales bacterium]|jgi:hypothetical protein